MSFRSTLLMASIGFVALLGATQAAAEARTPPGEALVPTVRIEAAAISPARATVRDSGLVVLTNDSSAMARIEFRLKRGHGIECSSQGDTPVKARKFVVNDGDALLCNTPPGRYDYTVYQNVRGTGPQATKGRIDVR